MELTMNKFEEISKEAGRIISEKNLAYGDSFSKAGDILSLLYPSGIRPDQYKDMLAIVRVIDKLFRIATFKCAFGESPWLDIAGYGILGASQDAEVPSPQPVAPPSAPSPSIEEDPIIEEHPSQQPTKEPKPKQSLLDKLKTK
jgi:hypothetical protein